MIAETLQMVLQKLKEHRSFYEQNEMAVRDQIVNPILKSLGWDTENPEEVQPNLPTQEGVPDYTLFNKDKKILFIEAKNLSVDIVQADAIRQLAMYCFAEGISYGVLTNGAVWILFRAFQPGTTMEERIVWKIDIEKDDINAMADTLNQISKLNTIIKKSKKSPILVEVWRSLLEEPEYLAKGFVPVFESLVKEAYPKAEFERGEIEEFIKECIAELIFPSEEITEDSLSPTGKFFRSGLPRTMRLETDSYPVKNPYEILVNVGQWLIEKGKLRKENCPIASGQNRYLVNTEPRHRCGEGFQAPKLLTNGLFMETNNSIASCIINARKLLERCGYPGKTLEL